MLAEEQSLVVSAEGYLVSIEIFEQLHLFVQLLDLLMLLTGATCFKHASVDDFNFAHWLKFLSEVLE